MKILFLLPLLTAVAVSAESSCPEFDLCDFDDENHPAHECYINMNRRIQESVKADCSVHVTAGTLDFFQQNIELVCSEKGYPVNDVPTCETETTPCPEPDFEMCDFDDANHPAHDCYAAMSSQIQKSVKADCTKYDGTEKMDDFRSNIELLCEAKGVPVVEMPTCPTVTTCPPFDMCAFDDDGHPAHDCYAAMSSQIQKSVKADCTKYEGTEKMDDFRENIMLLCEAKGLPVGEVPSCPETTCPPLDMCGFDDGSHPAHDCYAAMSSQIQKSVKADCTEYEGTEAMDVFRENIMLLCEAKGLPVGEIPSCIDATTTFPA